MLTKIAKTLVAGLVLTSVSLSVASTAYAGPMTHQQEAQWFNRASNPNTNGGF